jgi:Mg-chelatase subunit ChlD
LLGLALIGWACSSSVSGIRSGDGGQGTDGATGDGGTTGDGPGVNPNDTDGDGIENAIDNCPDVPNADQLNFDSDDLGDPCDPDPPPETCGDARVSSSRLAPNVLVMLDRSLSMSEDNKWTDATAALDTLSSSLADQLRLGLALFPGKGGGFSGRNCREASLELAVGDHSAAEFQASYAGESPSGYTPMRRALERPRTQGWLDDASDPDDAARSKNVLLVTDGVPNCAVGHESDYEHLDIEPTLDQAQQLHDSGVTIYVVGFGEGVDASTLNQLAEKGGTDNPSDTENRYFQANSGAELGCTLTLAGRPAAPERIYVLLGDTPQVRDSPDGFVYDEATNTIELQGAACDAVKSASPPVITVIFGCPPDGRGPIID